MAQVTALQPYALPGRLRSFSAKSPAVPAIPCPPGQPTNPAGGRYTTAEVINPMLAFTPGGFKTLVSRLSRTSLLQGNVLHGIPTVEDGTTPLVYNITSTSAIAPATMAAMAGNHGSGFTGTVVATFVESIDDVTILDECAGITIDSTQKTLTIVVANGAVQSISLEAV